MYMPSVPSTFVVAICGRAGACDQAAEAAAASPQARAATNMRFMSPPCVIVRCSARTGRGPRLFPLDRASFAMLLGLPCLVACKGSCLPAQRATLLHARIAAPHHPRGHGRVLCVGGAEIG